MDRLTETGTANANNTVAKERAKGRLHLTGETVIRKDSFDIFDRRRNIPGGQEHRATNKAQESHDKDEP